MTNKLIGLSATAIIAVLLVATPVGSRIANHYNTCFSLSLTEQEKGDLVEYLKSL